MTLAKEGKQRFFPQGALEWETPRHPKQREDLSLGVEEALVVDDGVNRVIFGVIFDGVGFQLTVARNSSLTVTSIRRSGEIRIYGRRDSHDSNSEFDEIPLGIRPSRPVVKVGGYTLTFESDRDGRLNLTMDSLRAPKMEPLIGNIDRVAYLRDGVIVEPKPARDPSKFDRPHHFGGEVTRKEQGFAIDKRVLLVPGRFDFFVVRSGNLSVGDLAFFSRPPHGTGSDDLDLVRWAIYGSQPIYVGEDYLKIEWKPKGSKNLDVKISSPTKLQCKPTPWSENFIGDLQRLIQG